MTRRDSGLPRRRGPRRPSGWAPAVFGLGLLLFAGHFALDVFATNLGIRQEVRLGHTSLLGFSAAGDTFTSAARADHAHVLAREIRLQPHEVYEVGFQVSRVPVETIDVSVDIYGKGFDDPGSERTVPLRPTEAGTRVRLLLPVGDAPQLALLRVFYVGPPGLTLSGLRAFRVAEWLAPVRTASWWLAGGLLLLACALVLLDDDFSYHSRWHGKPVSANAGWLLIWVAYLVAVPIRFAVYRATPYWSGDEYVYKSIASGIWEFGTNAALTSNQFGVGVNFPNALYPHLIAPAFALGDDFYTGVRLINAVVMNAAVFPAYALARRFFDVGPAFWLAVFVLCMPSLGLGAFAVTEALFFPVYLAAAWAAVRAVGDQESLGTQVLAGILAALAVNVRPTGVTVLPAFLLAVGLYALARGDVARLWRRPTWLAGVVGFGLAQFAMQATAPGPDSEGLGFYSRVLQDDRATAFLDLVRADPTGPLRLLLGHLLTLAVPYALPVAAILVSVPSLRSLFRGRERELGLVVVALMFASSLIGITVAFSLYVAPVESVDRWHGRYYFACLPVLLIAGLVCARRLAAVGTSRQRRGTLVVTIAFLAVGAFTLFGTSVPASVWWASPVDNMNVQWEHHWPVLYLVFGLSTVLGVALWSTSRPGARPILLATAVVWFVVATGGVVRQSKVGEANPPTACGRALAPLVSASDARFAVFGAQHYQVVGLGFWMARTPVLSRVVLPGTSVEEIIRPMASLDLLLMHEEVLPPPGFEEVDRSGECVAYAPVG